MPQNTLYVTGFAKETKASELAPEFEKFGELVRLDIPPPRSEESSKFAFVEYKNAEDCEKALELNGQESPLATGEGLVVQVARSDPMSRRGYRSGSRGGYGGRGERGPRGDYGRAGGYGGRGGRGGYGYPGTYPPARGGRDGYGYPSYGYEGGDYGSDYGGGYGSYPSRGGRDASYGGRPPAYGAYESGYGGRDASHGSGYGGYDGARSAAPYTHTSYGYRGTHDAYRGAAADERDRERGYEPRDSRDSRDDREPRDRDSRDSRDPRDRYYGSARRTSDRNYSSSDRPYPDEPRESPAGSSAAYPGEQEDYGRGRYSRTNSPSRDRSRSRSPSR